METDTASVVPAQPAYSAYPSANTTTRVNLRSACPFEALGIRYVGFQFATYKIELTLEVSIVSLETPEALKLMGTQELLAVVKIWPRLQVEMHHRFRITFSDQIPPQTMFTVW